MAVRVEATASAADFLEHAGSFLEEREAAHCLTLGTAGALREDPSNAATFLVASVAGRVVAAAYWLDGEGADVLLSAVDDPHAIRALADALTSKTREVHAPAEHIDGFAGAIAARLGRTIVCRHNRIYEAIGYRPVRDFAWRLLR